MRRIAILPLLAFLLLASGSFAQQAPAQPAGAGQLTIPAIFAEGGVTGRAPESLQWSPDGKRFSYVLRDDAGEHGALYYVDLSTGKSAVLVAQEKLSTLAPPAGKVKNEREQERLTRYSVAGYHWAPDSKHILFDAHGQLWLYSLDSGTAVQATSNPEPSGDPKFAPDGKRIAFLRKHELWVRAVSNDREEETQLTSGKEGRGARVQFHLTVNNDQKKPESGPDDILNGEVDWVYAEELGVRSNYFWSPDGKQIAYLQMDESKVPSYPIEDFMPANPEVDNQKYPKAGDPNPVVRVGVVGSGGGKTRWIELPGEDRGGKDETSQPPDILIPSFGWVRPGLLYVVVQDRLQTRAELYFVDSNSGRSRKALAEESPAWIMWDQDYNGNPTMLPSGREFLWRSWRDGHLQIYLYSFDAANPLAGEAKLERQLTHGEYEVTAIDGASGDAVYFTSTSIGARTDPRQRQLWSVKLAGGEPVRVSRDEGTHGASFAEAAGGYYVDSYSALMAPPRMSLCKVDGTCSEPFWASRAVEQFALAKPQWLELKAADQKTTLYGTLVMPPRARSEAKIPLLVYAYGGPGVQTVQDAWGGTTFLFHQIMAQHGFAVLMVDNRGGEGRGRDFAAAIKGHMGELPLQDQLAALEQVLAQHPELDAERLGWWGWSYGGYMTVYAMTHDKRFKAGVSVAPVTDFRNYDSIYTERYMGLPKEKAEDYKRVAAMTSAAELSGRLLEVHGTSDDNVHMQNTIQMVNALVEANKQFDLMLYPRKTHSIAGTAARVNLFEKIQEHFDRWLLGAVSGQP